MRAAGSQTRVAAEEVRTSTRVVTSNVRQWPGTALSANKRSRPWEREACGCDASGTQEIAAVHTRVLSICCCLIFTTCLLRRQLATNAFHECRERCPYLSWRIFLQIMNAFDGHHLLVWP